MIPVLRGGPAARGAAGPRTRVRATVPPTRSKTRSRNAVAGAGGHMREPPEERIARLAHRGWT